ncbi:MAG: TetR/AcrR family transcriptional regulator [Candidatus Marinimicrobia bacterium]|nr:TetR/AcrR family transcriptional regulator [Candidatus Neomarinimicrobiota bacterium]
MKKNAKKQLQDATWELIQKKGMKALRVQEICQLAELSKVTFYYYYKNKHDIIENVLKEWIDEKLREAKDIMYQNTAFNIRVLDMVQWKAEFVKKISPVFLRELYESGGSYMNLLKDTMGESQKLMNDFFTFGKENRDLNPDVDISTLIQWMNVISDATIEGKFDTLFDDPKKMHTQLSSLMLYGMMGNREEKT